MLFIYCFAGFVALSVAGIVWGIFGAKEKILQSGFATSQKIQGKINRIRDHHFDKNPEGTMRYYDSKNCKTCKRLVPSPACTWCGPDNGFLHWTTEDLVTVGESVSDDINVNGEDND